MGNVPALPSMPFWRTAPPPVVKPQLQSILGKDYTAGSIPIDMPRLIKRGKEIVPHKSVVQGRLTLCIYIIIQ